MHTYLIEMLVCPVCHEALNWRVDKEIGERIESAEATCTICRATYPVWEGIGLFLTPDLPRNDLWEEVGSGLIRFLRANPEYKAQMLDGPVEALAPADQFLRAMLLEERGRFQEAKVAHDLAFNELYTQAYSACWQSQVDYVVEVVSKGEGPVVDLASGRGYLAEALVRRLERPLVVTDFSPSVLRRNRGHFQTVGLYDHISLLAFDARKTPFKDNSVKTMTTNLGLPNIEEPGNLVRELRRVVSGEFLAINHFFPEEDTANGQVIEDAGLEAMLYRESAVAHFVEAGWEVELRNSCLGQARPTPPSVIIDGLRIDGLPVAETMLEWSVLHGN